MLKARSLKVQALEDIWAFADLIKFKGGSKKFSQLHYELGDFVTAPQQTNRDPAARRRITLLPRGHLKSTVNTVLYTLWRIYRNPNIRILVGTNTKKLSMSFVRELRNYFENPTLIETVWNARPHIKGRLVPELTRVGRRRASLEEDDTIAEDRKVVWNNYAIQVVRKRDEDDERSNAKEPTVFACSVGMQLTGDHYDLLILDDIVDFDNSSSPEKAMKVEEWAQDLEAVVERQSSWYSITDHFGEYIGDEVVINGTRYFKHDFYSTYVGNSPEECQSRLTYFGYKLFFKNIYVNGKDSADGYIFPEKFNDTVVSQLKRQLKTRRFAAQYLMMILASDEMVLDATQVKYLHESDVTVRGQGYAEVLIDNVRRPVYLHIVVDPAASQNKGADDTCVGVGGTDFENNVILVDMKAKRMKPSEIIEVIYQFADKWQLSSVWIETNAQQEMFLWTLREEFKRRRPLAARAIKRSQNKKERLEYQLEPVLSNSKLYTFGRVTQHTPLSEQLEYFPSEQVKDDCIDVLATIVEVSRPTNKKATENRGNVVPFAGVGVNSKYGGIR